MDVEAAKEWAFSIVSTDDASSLGIIDIATATANGRLAMLDTLGIETHDADIRMAARWLLDCAGRWSRGRLTPGEAIRQAAAWC